MRLGLQLVPEPIRHGIDSINRASAAQGAYGCRLPPAAVAAAQSVACFQSHLLLPKPIAPRPVEAATGLFESQRSMATSTEPAAKAQTGVFDSSTSEYYSENRSTRIEHRRRDSAMAHPLRHRRIPPHRIPYLPLNSTRSLASPAVRQPDQAPAFTEPIEILAKPRPIYTDEARRLRIEGEVVLEVLFRASAQVCVLRVVKEPGSRTGRKRRKRSDGHPLSSSRRRRTRGG